MARQPFGDLLTLTVEAAVTTIGSATRPPCDDNQRGGRAGEVCGKRRHVSVASGDGLRVAFQRVGARTAAAITARSRTFGHITITVPRP